MCKQTTICDLGGCKWWQYDVPRLVSFASECTKSKNRHSLMKPSCSDLLSSNFCFYFVSLMFFWTSLSSPCKLVWFGWLECLKSWSPSNDLLAAVPCQRLYYPPQWWRLCGYQSWWWILLVLLTGRTGTSRERNDQGTKVSDSSSSSSSSPSSLCCLLCSWGLQLGETSPVGKSEHNMTNDWS